MNIEYIFSSSYPQEVVLYEQSYGDGCVSLEQNVQSNSNVFSEDTSEITKSASTKCMVIQIDFVNTKDQNCNARHLYFYAVHVLAFGSISSGKKNKKSGLLELLKNTFSSILYFDHVLSCLVIYCEFPSTCVTCRLKEEKALELRFNVQNIIDKE